MRWTAVSLCALAVFPIAVLALDRADLLGRWQTASGSIVQIAEDEEGRLHGYLAQPTSDAISFGYSRDEEFLRNITLQGDTARLEYSLRPQRPELVALTHLHRYVPATLVQRSDPKRLIVTRAKWRYVALEGPGSQPAAFQVVEEEGTEDTVLTRLDRRSGVLPRIAALELSGYRNDAPVPVDVLDPVLPRFHLSEEGFPSVDLDLADARRARAIRIEAYEPGDDDPDLLGKAEVNPPELTPNPVSAERWTTLNLHRRLLASAEVDSLEPEEGVQWWVELEYPDGSKTRHRAPPSDRYRTLDAIKQRADFLSQYLFELPFWFVRDWAETSGTEGAIARRAATAWTVFLQKAQRLTGRVLLESTDPASAAEGRVSYFGLQPNGTYTRISDEDFYWTGSETTFPRYFKVPDEVWSATGGKRLVAVQAVLGPDPETKVRSAAEDDHSAIYRFDLDLSDPRRLAASRIAVMVDGNGVTDAARRFMALRPREGASGYNEILAGQAAAREHAALLAEFESLLVRANAAFAGREMGRLHDLLHKHPGTLHVGHPVEDTGPVIRSRDYIPPGFAIREDYILEKPDSESFMRGVGAAMTGNKASGDIPIDGASAEYLLERDAELDRRRIVHDSQSWQTPRGYLDGFLSLSPEEAAELTRSIEGRKPLDQVRGEVTEALAAREHGRRAVSALRAAGRRPIHLKGWSLYEYDFTPGHNRLGLKIGDGVVLSPDPGGSPATRMIRVHEIHEVKAGDASEEAIRGQLRGHEVRFRRNGITVVRPARSDITYFAQQFGIQPRIETIAGVPTTVLHIPANRLVFEPPSILHRPIVASDYVAAGPVGRVSLLRRHITDLSAELIARNGLRLTPWNDPRLSERGYLDYYNRLTDAGLAPRSTSESVAHRFANGDRYNPSARKWENIFVGPLENTNPFMSWTRMRQILIEQSNFPRAQIDGELKRRFYEDDWRWNPARPRGFQCDHMINPHDPTLTENERLRLYRAMVSRSTLSDMEALDKFRREGLIYDHTVHRWVTPDSAGFVPDPEFERDLRNSYRRTRVRAGAAVAASALAAISDGILEAERISRLRLKVQVRQKEGSDHTFIIVLRGNADHRGDVAQWYAIDDPWVQKFLLVQWFRGGRGFFESAEIPGWLQGAAPDGPSCNWHGPR